MGSTRIKFGLITALVFSLLSSAFAQAERNLASNSYNSSVMDYMQTPPGAGDADQRGLYDGRKFPRLWMGSIRWEQPIETARYDVDVALSPVLDLNYTFQLQPQLRNPDNHIRHMAEGYYVLRMVVLRPSMQEDNDTESGTRADLSVYRRYVAGTERIVQLSQGVIKTNVSLRFHTISATAMRNTLLIQMLPIKTKSLKFDKSGLVRADSSYELDDKPGYFANVIRIPFVPRYSSGLATPPTAVTAKDVNTHEEFLDLGLFLRQAENLIRYSRIASQKPKDPKPTAKALGLAYFDLESSEVAMALGRFTNNNSPNLTSAQLADEISKINQTDAVLNEGLAASFCRLLTARLEVDSRLLGHGDMNKKRLELLYRNQMFANCVFAPEQHFTLIRQLHVREIGDRPNDTKYVQGAPIRMGLNANFATNRSHTQDTTSTWSQGISPLFSPIDLRGVVRLGYSYNISDTNTRARFEGTMVSAGVDLEAHQWDMSVTLNDYTPCLAVVPKVHSPSWTTAKTVTGLYLCDRASRHSVQVTERFYHIFPSATSSPTLDLLNPRNQVVNMVLRGQRDYYAFLSAIRGFIRPSHDQKQNIASELRQVTRIYAGSSPSIATVFSYPVALEGPKSQSRAAANDDPSFWDRFFHRHDPKID
ncbi:MAG: hypothetical protein AB7N80_15365 [Bdellovibrionales bacterium]